MKLEKYYRNEAKKNRETSFLNTILNSNNFLYIYHVHVDEDCQLAFDSQLSNSVLNLMNLEPFRGLVSISAIISCVTAGGLIMVMKVQ
jgi:hypothetical protein